MAHVSLEALQDVEDVLEKIRSFGVDVREPKPAVFYIKSVPFLHFHVKGDQRFAHAKSGKNWGPALNLPLKATAKQKNEFVESARRYYSETVSAIKKS